MDKPKKRRMVQFKLVEISSVDYPAQQGARARIMKNAGPREFHKVLPFEVSGIVYPDTGEVMKLNQETDMSKFDDGLAALKKQSDEINARIAALEKKRDTKVETHDADSTLMDAARAEVRKRLEIPQELPNDFRKRVEEIRRRDKCTRQEAMRKARFEHPEEYEKKQTDTFVELTDGEIDNEARALIAKGWKPETRATKVVTKAPGDFMDRVNDIRKRDRISRQEAMRKARMEHPESFAQYDTATREWAD